MKSRIASALLFVPLSLVALGAADNPKPDAAKPDSVKPNPQAHLSKETRMDLIRTFNAELVYVRTPFPMGKKGLTLRDGKISPDGPELQQLIAMWGPSVKPGDQARITEVDIKDRMIHFEINGGPVRKQKWYQHLQVGGAGGMVPVAPSDSNANPRGSYVDLLFEHYVPDLSPQQLKDLLRPVFDFDAKTAVEAYLETVPPKVKEAIKAHQVLVGMNREMVLYAKGRPPKKEREKDGDTEYEEWIYGEPPQDVNFVRFVGDEVTRVETMKVDGEKIVKTEREVTLQPEPSVAAKQPEAEPQVRPANAPTLRRPGEQLPSASPTTAPSTSPGPPQQGPPPLESPMPPAQGPPASDPGRPN